MCPLVCHTMMYVCLGADLPSHHSRVFAVQICSNFWGHQRHRRCPHTKIDSTNCASQRGWFKTLWMFPASMFTQNGPKSISSKEKTWRELRSVSRCLGFQGQSAFQYEDAVKHNSKKQHYLQVFFLSTGLCFLQSIPPQISPNGVHQTTWLSLGRLQG